ncbi:MAG: DUF3488 and transglutaminase-like domain-containing protein [Lachnospiraceae bacterium]|nr:DUF3488 and transglutaminase-like domain-containing protein [Lachnospiraceae bacterium]
MHGGKQGSAGAKQGRKAGKKRNLRRYGRQTYTVESDRRSGKSPAARVLSVCLACVLTALLAVDCLMLYTSVFSLTGTMSWHVLFLVVVSAVLTLIMYLPWGGWWYLLHVAALLLPVFFMKRRLLGGFRSVFNELVEFINPYFHISLSKITIEGVTVWDNESHMFLLYLLTLCIWPMAYGMVRSRKPVTVLLPPVLFVALPLAVGKTPGTAAILVFFLAVVGTLGFLSGGVPGDGHRTVPGSSHAVVCICLAAAVLAVTWNVTYERAQGLVEDRGEIEAMVADGIDYAIRTVESLPGGFSWFGMSDPGRISNREPRYRNKEVLRLTVSKLPEDTVYLRGYVGDSYDHGKWTNEGDSYFADEVTGWQQSLGEDAGSHVQSMPAHNLASMLNTRMDYQVEYTDPPRQYAYLPYYTDTASALDGFSGDSTELIFIGDSIVEREDQGAVCVSGYQENGLMDTQSGLTMGEESEFSHLYGIYAERYTQVDENLQDLKTLGDSLNRTYKNEYASYVDQTFSQEIAMGAQSLLDAREQLRKLICISMVQQELWKRTYDLKLDRVPFGQDVVEYFLFQGEEGFCEHFASAGVLLLREMGVPARYVSGYTVRVSDFTSEKNAYTAVVMDNRAHAWAEVYMDGVGWVPVEMTPGGNAGNGELQMTRVGNTLQIREGDGATGSARVLYGDQPEDQENSESTAVQPDTQMQETERENPTETEQEQSPTGIGQPDHDGSDDKGYAFLWIPIVVAILLAAAAIVLVYRRRVLPGRKISYASPGRAVEQLSGQIYRLLRQEGFIRGKVDSDAEFRRQLLEQTVIGKEEIIRYLDILEKAAYSRQEITASDVEFCRQFYRRLEGLQKGENI